MMYLRFLITTAALHLSSFSLLIAQDKYDLPENLTRKAVFEEEFNNNSNKWNLTDLYPCYTVIEKGRLSVHSEDFGGKIVKNMRFNVKKDFEIEFSMRWISGDSLLPAGLIYAASKEKYYKLGFSLVTQRFLLEKRVFDKDLPIDQKENLELSNEFFNIITVRVVKKKMYLFVNKQLVYTGIAPKPIDNYFGFFVPGTSIYAFDYINIYYLEKLKSDKRKEEHK